MASISAPGLGSDLDVNGLVTQLMDAERAGPEGRLDRREELVEARISALGAVKSALSEFSDSLGDLSRAGSFQTRTATVADDAFFVFSATPTSIAVPGSYSVEVQNLAQTQKLATDAYSSATVPIGTGTLSFSFGTYDSGGNTFTVNPALASRSVSITAADDSLQGIRDAVNRADIGVTASLVNDGNGQRLVFTAPGSGADSTIRLTVTDDDGNNTNTSGLSQLAFDPTAGAGTGKNINQTVTGLDAALRVDGIDISSASNTVAGAIPGVTLNLASAAPGSPATLTVSQDSAAISEAVSDFVESYNGVVAAIGAVASYDAETGKAGVLLGDATVNSIASSLRSTLGQVVSGLGGAYDTLASIGISTQKDGTLALDGSALSAALDADLDGVAALFAATGRSTDSFVTYVTAGDDVVAGDYAVNITQLATQGSLTGAAASSFVVDANNDTLSLAVNGITSGTITLTQQTYASGDDLAAELQSQINGDSALAAAGVAVAVSYDSGSGAFSITSNRYGSASTVELTGVDTNTTATLGLSAAAGTAGVDVAGTIGGVAATGSGRLLTGTGDAKGLVLEIGGITTGDRGTLSFTRGVADQLDSRLDDLLASGGLISSKNAALSREAGAIDDDRDRLETRLTELEERYRAQFSALDSLVANLKTTGDFLTQQLQNLPGFGGDQ